MNSASPTSRFVRPSASSRSTCSSRSVSPSRWSVPGPPGVLASARSSRARDRGSSAASSNARAPVCRAVSTTAASAAAAAARSPAAKWPCAARQRARAPSRTYPAVSAARAAAVQASVSCPPSSRACQAPPIADHTIASGGSSPLRSRTSAATLARTAVSSAPRASADCAVEAATRARRFRHRPGLGETPAGEARAAGKGICPHAGRPCRAVPGACHPSAHPFPQVRCGARARFEPSGVSPGPRSAREVDLTGDARERARGQPAGRTTRPNRPFPQVNGSSRPDTGLARPGTRAGMARHGLDGPDAPRHGADRAGSPGAVRRVDAPGGVRWRGSSCRATAPSRADTDEGAVKGRARRGR